MAERTTRRRRRGDSGAHAVKRHRGTTFLEQLRASQRALEREQAANTELRMLLRSAQIQIEELLRSQTAHFQRFTGAGSSGQAERHAPRSWWSLRDDKKGLGAGLTLSGFLAGIVGLIFHFAMQHHVVATVMGLGYSFGLIGLILFLIGLVLVW